MKNRFLLLFIFLIILNSCKENLVNFTDPQPTNTKNIKEFPTKLLGIYFNPESEIQIQIEKKLIIKYYLVNNTINFNKFSQINDSDKKFYSQLSDSLFIGKHEIIDTIFNISNKDILRKFKGNYYLNNNENDLWAVSKLQVKKNFIILSQIQNESDLKLLDEISEKSINDSVYPKTYNLNKNQFKEFVKKNGFSEGEIFIKK